MGARIKRPLAGCLACVAGLALVRALAFEAASLQHLDAQLVSRLSADREALPGSVARAVVHLGDPLPQIALLALACLAARRWGRGDKAIVAVVLVAAANLTTQLLKVVLAQPRYEVLLAPHQIPATAFPSGHATATMAMALAFVLVAPPSRRRLVAGLGACLVVAVGCSLVIMHRHYPSDVVGGWLVAGASFFAVVAGLRIRERDRAVRRRNAVQHS